MKNKILVAAVICICLLCIIYYLINSTDYHKDRKEDGDIILSKEEEPEDDLTFDEEWIRADNELGVNYNLSINDPDECFSQSGFLTVKGHMTKCEAIYNYLLENGYQENSVTVISETAIHNGNNSYICLNLDNYPGTVLEVAFYGLTEEFAFAIKE